MAFFSKCHKTGTHLTTYVAGFIAVFLHAYLLYRWIDVSEGQNLYFLNVLSVIAWLSCGLILVSVWRRPIANLMILLFPLAALSILAVQLFPGENLIRAGAHPKQLLHILASILAFSVLCIAALQAFLVALQNYLLRTKRVAGLVHFMPPYETMEALLFEIIGFGFVLFTLVLFSSILWFYGGSLPKWEHVSYLFLLAWVVLTVLLWGRYQRGWRGRMAIRCSGVGMALLAIAYAAHWVLF
jgi:ABC-type uncharacterized transport system permease subunit